MTVSSVSGPAVVSPTSTAEPAPDRPPIAPRWVYEPWVWEDSQNTQAAVQDLVARYREHRIPVGAVILDSPWQTNYNTFRFGSNYPDPGGLIRDLHAQGIRVVLWATSFINVRSASGPERGKASNYDEALAAGYFVDGGKVYHWWQGDGSSIDFFNPRAVAWWYGQMDQAFGLGADGWKVDDAESELPDFIQTAAGRKSRAEYREAYYRAFYRYVVERKPDGVTLARPYVERTVFAPIDAAPVGWVGDQGPEWEGLQEAFEYILESAKRGYAVVGSDIGGRGDSGKEYDGALFIRWLQLGALSPLMENGGRGERRPWLMGEEVLRAYRYYAKLHHQLVPYLYSLGVEANRTGRPIIRDASVEDRKYQLGPDLFVAPVVEEAKRRRIELPEGTRWYDFWDDERVLTGGKSVRQDVPLERIPLFVREGAMIPMEVADGETGHGGAGSAGHLTILAYPGRPSSRTLYLDAAQTLELRSAREGGRTTVEIGPRSGRYVVRIKEPSPPRSLTLERAGSPVTLPTLPSWEALDRGAEGWYYDAGRRYLWVRFATEGTGARLSYQAPR